MFYLLSIQAVLDFFRYLPFTLYSKNIELKTGSVSKTQKQQESFTFGLDFNFLLF